MVIEGRGPSVQPTPEEDTALAFFLAGSLAYRSKHRVEVQPLGCVYFNEHSAQREGLSGQFMRNGILVPTWTAVDAELRNAGEGLSYLGFSAEEIQEHLYWPLERRIIDKRVPADEFELLVKYTCLPEAMDRWANKKYRMSRLQ